MEQTASTLITLGGLLLIGLTTEWLGRRTPLPRVSLLLFFGFLFGRSMLGWIPDVTQSWFPTIANMALVMVGFLLGEKLSYRALKTRGRLVLSISIAVVGSTAAIVLAAMVAFGVPLPYALLLAGIAPATAPAATLDVVRELKAKGPFSSTLMGVVAVDDAWGLLLFSFLLAAAELISGTSGSSALTNGVWDVFGAVLLGTALGLPMSYLAGRIEPGEPSLAEALGSVLLCGGLAIALDVSFLVAAMTMGIVVANLARHHERPFHAIEGVEWPFIVLFFILAGSELRIDLLWQTGWVLAIYVLARVAGRLVGAWLGARNDDSVPPDFRKSMGWALMPQAGVALGMTLLAIQRLPSFESYLSLVVGATIVFELTGPVFTRRALIRMGESGTG
jgi:Kef-type K+ transport system membrane component KefB